MTSPGVVLAHACDRGDDVVGATFGSSVRTMRMMAPLPMVSMLLLLLLSACTRAEPTHRTTGRVFGTVV